MNTLSLYGVRVEIADGVASIILNRPDDGNALDLETSRSLAAAFRWVEDSDEVRAIVLRGSGPRFCVGGDLRAFRDAPAEARLCDHVARPLHDAILSMGASRCPVICLVHGAVGGGGNGLVLAADIAVATRSTVFRLGYTGSGLTPDCGVTYQLPRLIGQSRALDIALTNMRLTAEEAAYMGIISRVVDDGDLDGECKKILAKLALVPPETLAETKRLMRGSPNTSLVDQLDDEAITIGRIGDSVKSREAISAFLDRRTPRYN